MARTPLGFLLWYVCENEIWNSNKFQNPDVTVARWRIVLDLNTCIEVSCREELNKLSLEIKYKFCNVIDQ